ncbi:type II toxin-antitoxin system RelE/ParE family toxin [Tistrella mobilis]|uniref:Addiction module toxin, RelE/StbE family n=1 Tax=Tistrella mobilis (strain KA081020-065) TaxID=1110502 RepID=I3TTS5_TISMK|nr:type II toxin-antitoxin system RelE/ParE family toxin [Tistrella mobilis]AFK56163.1 addiction module toxin, RelE/StbE family [Tistrella mobilis KA081020-065]MAM72243.1 type II toxin-antitoxin system RelE/ParE family toxin [Tistrella sp.]
MRIIWSRFAALDRERIFDRIAAHDLGAAIGIDERIQQQSSDLARFPQRGRPGRIPGTRELVIHGTPYILAYRPGEETVRLLRLLHGAQLWPDELE